MGLVNLLPARVIGAEEIEAGPLRLRLKPPDGIHIGDPVDLAIRPEAVRLLSQGAAPDGAVPARVEEQSYLGNLSEYQSALAGGIKLRVQAQAMADFPVGATVLAAVDAEQCNVFRSDAAGDES